MEQAGFINPRYKGETGFESSPITKGALFQAVKNGKEDRMHIDQGLKKYREFFEIACQDGAINTKMKHLIALGASLGAGCEP